MLSHLLMLSISSLRVAEVEVLLQIPMVMVGVVVLVAI
jgi:hypothetical protein